MKRARNLLPLVQDTVIKQILDEIITELERIKAIQPADATLVSIQNAINKVVK